jgi:transmembrane sensor
MSRSELPIDALKSALTPATITPAEVASVWRNIAAAQPAANRSRVVLRWALAVTLAVCAGVTGVFALRVPREASGSLQLRDGADLVELPLGAPLASAMVAHQLVLADGSRIAVSSGASLSVLENDAMHLVLKQSQGTVHYEVTPGGARRWVIEAPLATIEVVGTGFTIDADTEHVQVDVAHGIVLVRGDRVPEHVQRLTAGQHLAVAREPTAYTTSSAVAPPPVAAAPAPPKIADGPPVLPAVLPTGMPTQANTGSLPGRTAGVLLPQDHDTPALAANSSIEALFVRADIARRAGHPEQAHVPLEQIVAGHAHDSRTPLAAFSLARLYLDSLGRPADAARMFERSLALGLSTALVQDAFARRVEAWSRAGDSERTRAAIADYTQRYPADIARIQQWRVER